MKNSQKKTCTTKNIDEVHENQHKMKSYTEMKPLRIKPEGNIKYNNVKYNNVKIR